MTMSYIEVTDENGYIINDLQYRKYISDSNALIDQYKRDLQEYRKKPTEKMAKKLLKECEYISAAVDLAKNAYKDEPHIIAAITKHANEAILQYQTGLIYGLYREQTPAAKTKSIEELSRGSRVKSNYNTLSDFVKIADKANFKPEGLDELKQFKQALLRVKQDRATLNKYHFHGKNKISSDEKARRKLKLDHDELILRNKVIAKSKSLIVDPNVPREHERDLWKVVNYQNRKIEQLASHADEMKLYHQERKVMDGLVSGIVTKLDGFTPPNNKSRQVWIDDTGDRKEWDKMVQTQLPNMQIECKGGGNNPVYIVTDPDTGKVVVIRRLVLQGHFTEKSDRVGKHYLNALRQAKECDIDRHFCEMYGYVELGESSNKEKYYMEVSEAQPMDLPKKLNQDNFNLSTEEKMHNVVKYADAMSTMLLDFQKAGIFYPDVKPKNMLVNHNGELRISDIKSLFVRDSSGQIPVPYLDVSEPFTNNQTFDEGNKLNVDKHEKISLAISLFELATGELPERLGKSIQPVAHLFNFNRPEFHTPTGQKLKGLIIKLADPDKKIDKNIAEAEKFKHENQIETLFFKRLAALCETKGIGELSMGVKATFTTADLEKIFDIKFENGQLSPTSRHKYPEFVEAFLEDLYQKTESGASLSEVYQHPIFINIKEALKKLPNADNKAEIMNELQQQLTETSTVLDDKIKNLDAYIKDMTQFKQANKDFYDSPEPITIEAVKKELGVKPPAKVQQPTVSEQLTLEEQQKQLVAELKQAQKPIPTSSPWLPVPAVQTASQARLTRRGHVSAHRASESETRDIKTQKEDRKGRVAVHSRVLKEMEANPMFKKMKGSNDSNVKLPKKKMG